MKEYHKIHPCYRCGGTAHFQEYHDGHGFIVCYDCGMRTQMADSFGDAVKLWNPEETKND